jgi:signal transduction histidine kinase/ligand-binding sensor domain-containing protein/AraC-like DNA-binding protein
MAKRVVSFLLLFVLIAVHSFAQLQPKNVIKQWSLKDGLSQGVVNSITQDQQALMWFATEDGLNRFDGYSFKVFQYDPNNKFSIADNFIQKVFKDSEGTLWVSSRKGLLRFDPKLESFSSFNYPFKPTDTYKANDVSFITEGASNNLWVTWYGSGFASFDKTTEKFTPYTPVNLTDLTNAKAITLLEDKHGLLWVGLQEGGLCVFQVSKGKVVKKMHNLSGSFDATSLNVQCFAEDKFGNIWMGTSAGLIVYQRHENRFYTFKHNKFLADEVNIFSLLADSNENLWIGVQGGGMYQLDLRQFNNRTIDEFVFLRIKNLNTYDISKKTIQSIYEDKDKNVWVGTFGDGVYLISNTRENFIKHEKSTYDNTAISFVPYYGMCYDLDGNLWLGTDGDGIYKSDLAGNTLTHYTEESNCGLLDNAILSALCDSKGRLWFGTYSQGLFLYDKSSGSFVQYQYKSNVPSKKGGKDVRVIFEDSKNNIWVGTNRGGLCLLDEKGRTYSNPSHFKDALLNGDVRAITEDAKGNLWIGCYGDGVLTYSLNSKSFRRHLYDGVDEEQLKSDVVFAIEADRNNNIWIGTGGVGVCYYNTKDKTLTRFTEKDGLPNNTIYSILIDNADDVWVSTNAGISKLDTDQGKVSNYDVSDGLQPGQFNPGSAMFNHLGGYMCMGGTHGLNVFFPEQVKFNLQKPKVMLSDFLLFNKPVKVNDSTEGKPILKKVIGLTEDMVLDYDQNVFTFEFVGLNFSHPEKTTYAYLLEGLDDDWNYVGNQRTATYRYLEPGDYTFKVKATNIENEWPDDFASVIIVIKPPIWKTPLAYVGYVVCVVAISYSIFLVRKKQLQLRRRLKIEKSQRKRERNLVHEKMAFFTEVSHEFKTPLTLMIGPLEEMLAKESLMTPSGRKLQLVYRNAHKLLSLINKLLDFRKIESGNMLLRVKEGDVVTFTRDICATFRELSIHKNIRLNFYSEAATLMLWFEKEKLEMVLTNIISNSFKYIGKGNEISVHVSKQISDKFPHGRAVIKIKDNGIGIPKKQLGNVFDWFYKGATSATMSTGIGLSLAKKLIHLHKGEIYVDSVEGNGSTFSIKLPMGKEHFKPEEIITSVDVDSSLVESENGSLSFLTSEEHEKDSAHKKGLKSLLIIEDEDEIREFLKEYFEGNYKILEAPNGKDGLVIAAENHPDLIISDIMMPEMDGIEFCKAIKGNVRTSHIPIILLTAKTSLTNHKEGIQTGADAYITKPFSPEILGITVVNLLKSRENLMRFYRNLFLPDSHVESNGSLNPLDEKFLQSIYDLLKGNIEKPDFNINELCDVLNMSRSLVYKKVKTLTGLSPVEYIRSLRMQEAAKLLKTRQYKVFEVVYMVGFSDLKYFRQCFSKEFGFSPSEFIKQSEVGDSQSS